MEFQNDTDVYEYITMIEKYIKDASSVPLSKNKIIIDKDHMMYLLYTLKEQLPKEVRACQRYWKEQQEIAEEVLKREANGEAIITEVETFTPQAEEGEIVQTESKMVEDPSPMESVQFKAYNLILDAEQKGQEIIEEAQEKAKQLVADANEQGASIIDQSQEQGYNIIQSALVNADNILGQAQKVFDKHIEVVKQDKEELTTILKQLEKDRSRLSK